jgi:hypothetical protein
MPMIKMQACLTSMFGVTATHPERHFLVSALSIFVSPPVIRISMAASSMGSYFSKISISRETAKGGSIIVSNTIANIVMSQAGGTNFNLRLDLTSD